ncbi:hypothetical protein M5E87_20380 [Flavonifractor plautii]|nr:hypothetical protein M5E87_20380 [Flavonifractor plautii]
MKCWEVKSNGSKSNRTQLLAQYQTGARTFDGVLDPVKEDVRTLARADVADGVITQEEYQQYIGETYEPATETV